MSLRATALGLPSACQLENDRQVTAMRVASTMLTQASLVCASLRPHTEQPSVELLRATWQWTSRHKRSPSAERGTGLAAHL